MHLPGKPQQLPSQLWKNLSVLSWFTHPELECGSANRTLVEIPHVKEELDVETEVSGENPFREGAAFPTSRHSQGLSLCSQYNHLSPDSFLILFTASKLVPESLSSVFWNSTAFPSSACFHFALYWFNSVLICCPPQPHTCFSS